MRLSHANGRTVDVPEPQAAFYRELGWIDAPSKARSAVPGPSWTVKELREYADLKGIDLADAVRKGEILAVIVAAETPDEDVPNSFEKGNEEDTNGSDLGEADAVSTPESSTE